MENTIKVISSLFGTTLVVFLDEQLSQLTSSRILALIIAVISSVFAMFVFEYLTLNLPKRILFFRKFIYPLASFEGDWLQILPDRPDKPCSYCRVEYNPRTDSYSFYGTNFDNNGDESVTFYCQNIAYEEKLNGFTYSVEGQIDNTGEFMKCWGYVCFDKELFSRRFTIAKGYFVDIGTKLEGCRFFMRKITKEMIKQYSNNNVPKTYEEFKEFMKGYYLNRNRNENSCFSNKVN